MKNLWIWRSELSEKRWRRFARNRTTVFSLWLFLAFLFVSLTAEIWANSSPIYLRYNGENFFPVFRYYHPSLFGIEGAHSHVNFRTMELGENDFAIWPLIPWDPYERDREIFIYPSAPSATHILGTDGSGRDVAARLIYGFRYSMIFALSVWILVSFLGGGLGALMGFFGGYFDILGQRVVEVVESLPFLIVLMTLMAVMTPNILGLVLITSFLSWVGFSLYFRAEFLRLRKCEFVEASRAIGAGRLRQMFVHILPNSLTPWLTLSPFQVASSISTLVILDYLGYGLPAPTPSWGELLSQAQTHFQVAWWLAVYPSLALFLALTSLNFIGQGAREAFDPRH